MGGFLTPDSIDPNEYLRVVLVSKTLELIGAVNGQLLDLSDPKFWQQFGTLTPEEVAAYFQTVWLREINMSLAGIIISYACATCPSFALPCDGSSYARVDYPQLYAALDSVYILDADNFVVPDLRDVVEVGEGTSHALDDSGGEETHTLTTTEMPSHAHADSGHLHTEVTAVPTLIAIGAGVPAASAVPGVGVTGTSSANLTNTGGDGAHNNMQPYRVTRKAIIAF